MSAQISKQEKEESRIYPLNFPLWKMDFELQRTGHYLTRSYQPRIKIRLKVDCLRKDRIVPLLLPQQKNRRQKSQGETSSNRAACVSSLIWE